MISKISSSFKNIWSNKKEKKKVAPLINTLIENLDLKDQQLRDFK